MEGPTATNTLQALALVGVALYALRYALRWLGNQRGSGSPGRQLRCVETCTLGPKQRLHLVELDGEQLLVAATETRVSLLRRRPAPDRQPAQDGAERDAALKRAGVGPPTAEHDGHRRAAPQRGAGAGMQWLRSFLGGLVVVAACLWAPEVGAQDIGSQLPDLLESATQPDRISTTLELLLILTLFSIAPSVLLMATCFTRVVIVLALLRQALGVAQLPPNQVIIGLALAITVFAMAPVGAQLEREALEPYVANEIDAPVALERATGTVRSFLLRHTRERDLALFVSLSETPPESRDDVALFTLLPSFMLSEIRTAFEIGFTIFLPFLIVDLVIASMLISMQMIVLPPIVISLPFKLMLFVLLDGWNLVAGSLIDGLR